MRVPVKSHTLPIYKENRIASLLCIFETTVHSLFFFYSECFVYATLTPECIHANMEI